MRSEENWQRERGGELGTLQDLLLFSSCGQTKPAPIKPGAKLPSTSITNSRRSPLLFLVLVLRSGATPKVTVQQDEPSCASLQCPASASHCSQNEAPANLNPVRHIHRVHWSSLIFFFLLPKPRHFSRVLLYFTTTAHRRNKPATLCMSQHDEQRCLGAVM